MPGPGAGGGGARLRPCARAECAGALRAGGRVSGGAGKRRAARALLSPWRPNASLACWARTTPFSTSARNGLAQRKRCHETHIETLAHRLAPSPWPWVCWGVYALPILIAHRMQAHCSRSGGQPVRMDRRPSAAILKDSSRPATGRALSISPQAISLVGSAPGPSVAVCFIEAELYRLCAHRGDTRAVKRVGLRRRSTTSSSGAAGRGRGEVQHRDRGVVRNLQRVHHRCPVPGAGRLPPMLSLASCANAACNPVPAAHALVVDENLRHLPH